jgi:hypothetical protein
MKLYIALAQATLAATALFPLVAAAQDFPTKPIRLLIPFPPGGGTDTVSRVVATALSEQMKWQVVPENRPGAAGNLAVAQAAQAAPDGYTIVMGQTDNMGLGPHLYPNAGYDTLKSFVPIIQVSETPLAIVSTAAATGSQAKLANLADLLAKGKSQAGVTWATAGNGSLGPPVRRAAEGADGHQPAAGALQGSRAGHDRRDGRAGRRRDPVGRVRAAAGQGWQAHARGGDDLQALAGAARHAHGRRAGRQGARTPAPGWACSHRSVRRRQSSRGSMPRSTRRCRLPRCARNCSRPGPSRRAARRTGSRSSSPSTIRSGARW